MGPGVWNPPRVLSGTLMDRPTRPESEADRDDRRSAGLLLALAVALGCVRFWKLGTWSLWHDEALSLSDAFHAENQDNPLGYAILRFVYGLSEVPPSEFALRLLPCLLGIATIPLTAWAFRPFVGRRVAALAALLVAVSSWHVYWSQNARFYTLVMAATLLGGGLVLRGLWQHATWRVVVGMLVVAAAARLVHPSAVLLGGGLVVAPLLARALGLAHSPSGGRPWKALVAFGVLGVLAASPWMLGVFEQWVTKKGGAGPWYSGPAHFVLTTGFYLTPLLGTGALFGALLALRRRDPFGSLVLIICLAVVGAGLAVALRARVSAQYVFVLLPWVAVLAALPVGPLGRELLAPSAERRLRGPVLAAAAYVSLLVLPQISDLSLYFGVEHGERPRWKEAYGFVFAARQPDDLILGMEAPVGEYYLSAGRSDVRHWKNVVFLDSFRARLPRAWAPYPRRTWFVVNLEQLQDWAQEDRRFLQEVLVSECRLVRSFPVEIEARDLDVLVYLRD